LSKVGDQLRRSVRLKRIYDPPSEDDGYRVLSTRYWPRGVPRSACDEYITKTAPSRALLREFKHEGLSWEDYVPRYLDEMQAEDAKSAIGQLAARAKSGTITLMCICPDENRCHRSLLRNLIIQAAAREPTRLSR
jgi:uncharacterized protein YeaO (DUF488 family)